MLIGGKLLIDDSMDERRHIYHVIDTSDLVLKTCSYEKLFAGTRTEKIVNCTFDGLRTFGALRIKGLIESEVGVSWFYDNDACNSLCVWHDGVLDKTSGGRNYIPVFANDGLCIYDIISGHTFSMKEMVKSTKKMSLYQLKKCMLLE